MKSIRRISVAILLFVLIGFGVAYSQQQTIYDWLRLRDYQPSAEISHLATETTMNDTGRHLFYVHHPELNSSDQFNTNCSGFGEHTIVLGCFVSGQGIYLFDVDDPRLEGVEQVTAAHELLHAAYERLSTEEQSKIDTLTSQVLAGLSDERIKGTVENYRQRDPSVVSNELHSIIATEVRDLPVELENYYAKYFHNRLKIVEFSERYESVLTARRTKAATLEAQINGLKHEIELLEQTLVQQREALRTERAEVDNNSEVARYNQNVADYNRDVNRLNIIINQYNALVAEYKKNAVEAEELFEALNSKPTI